MKLWNRRWRVTVGTMQTSELDISFKIKRTLQGKPGTCELSIYNLTPSHRREAQQAQRTLVRVEAGYEGGMSQWFQGDARKVDIAREGGEWITKVTAGDGEYSIRAARGARSFGPDTRLEQVIRYAADAMGVGVGNVGDALQGRSLDRLGDTFPAGTVIRGRIARELGDILRSCGLDWSVQDGVLQVIPHGQALQRTAVELSTDTGLIESPEHGKHKTMKAKALLIPDLVPGRKVKLVSEMATGAYRIDVAEYTGDTRGDDWYAALTLQAAA